MKSPAITATRSEKQHAASLRNSALVDPNQRRVIPGRRYSILAVEGLLAMVASRAEHRNPGGLGAGILEWVKQAREDIHTGDWLKDKRDIAFAAASGDPEAIDLFAGAVKLTTTNIVKAVSNWASFFRFESLKDDEYPLLAHEILGMQMTIHTIGQDGGNRTIQAQPGDLDATPIPLHLRSTHWIEYALRDLYKGDVMQAALAQFDVALDRLDRLEELLASYLLVGGANTRLVENFVVAGDPSVRDYYPSRRVNTANLPTGNFVTLAGNSTTSVFRKEAFDAIIQYFSSWGAGVMESGNPSPVEVIVASAHLNSFLSQVGFSTSSNKLSDQVFENGYVASYAGRDWTLIGDNTIDPNQGVAYVRSTVPVGVMYDKPGFERVIQDPDANLLVQNKGRVCEQWVEAFAMPVHWRKHVFGVRYKTPA